MPRHQFNDAVVDHDISVLLTYYINTIYDVQEAKLAMYKISCIACCSCPPLMMTSLRSQWPN